jgi:hypothetical protein
VNEFDAIAGCARFATACAAATLSCSFVTRDASECAELTSPAAVAIETHALRSCNAVGVCADATRDDLQSRHAVIACVAHVTTFSLALSSSAWKLEGEVDSRTHDAAVSNTWARCSLASSSAFRSNSFAAPLSVTRHAVAVDASFSLKSADALATLCIARCASKRNAR